MKLVFIGASSFGLKCLEACLEIPEVEVTGIVTAPKTFSISYNPQGVTNVLHADVFEIGQTHNIPIKTLKRSMSEPGLFEAVAAWKPDAFLVAGWYHMIPKRWRDLAPTFGLHASLLPDYSGGAPLVWAMINGETRTGITLFQMNDGVDSGPIAGQREEPIHPDDTIGTLYARIEQQGLILIRETLPQIASGSLRLIPQDENRRRQVPQRSPADGKIDWNQSARVIERFIRAQTRPYPGAFTTLEGKPMHIWAATQVSSTESCASGQVQRIDDNTYTVRCGSNSIQLKEISYESETYTRLELARLFGGGGQRLGVSPSCLRRSKPC
jgi:methionyl-tRNA formyltransferase